MVGHNRKIEVAQGFEVKVAPLTGENFIQLRKELGQSQAEFGVTLKRAVDPNDPYPYTRQYVQRLEAGKDPITEKLASAFFSIAGVSDGGRAGINGAVAVEVRAAAGQFRPGVYVPPSVRERRCARPGCNVPFLSDNMLRKYHHPDCQKAHYEDVVKGRIKKILDDSPGMDDRQIAAILHIACATITRIRARLA